VLRPSHPRAPSPRVTFLWLQRRLSQLSRHAILAPPSRLRLPLAQRQSQRLTLIPAMISVSLSSAPISLCLLCFVERLACAA
jgi:hypothetical protein